MKTMTFTVEDALISPMGLAVLSGAGLINHDKSEGAHVHVTIEKVIGEDAGQPIVTVDLDDLRDETGFTTATGFDVCRKIPAYATVIGASGKAEDFLDLSVLPKPEEGQAEPETFKVTEDTPVVFSVESSNPVVGKTVVLDFYLIMPRLLLSVQKISVVITMLKLRLCLEMRELVKIWQQISLSRKSKFSLRLPSLWRHLVTQVHLLSRWMLSQVILLRREIRRLFAIFRFCSE